MKTKSLLGGLIIGAAMGTAAGLLFAPRTGNKTRKKLLRGSLKLKDDAVDNVNESLEALRTKFNEGIDQLAKRGQSAINHASEKAKI
jgi:gas vesicle protein